MPTDNKQFAPDNSIYNSLIQNENNYGGFMSSASALSESTDELAKRSTSPIPDSTYQTSQDDDESIDKQSVKSSDTSDNAANYGQMAKPLETQPIKDEEPTTILGSVAKFMSKQNPLAFINDVGNAALNAVIHPIDTYKKINDFANGSVLDAANKWDEGSSSNLKGQIISNNIDLGAVNDMQQIQGNPEYKAYFDWLANTWANTPNRHVHQPGEDQGPGIVSSLTGSNTEDVQNQNSPIDDHGNVKGWVNPMFNGKALAPGTSKPVGSDFLALKNSDQENNTWLKGGQYKYLSPYEQNVAKESKYPYVENTKKATEAFGSDIAGVLGSSYNSGAEDIPGLADVPTELRAAHIAVSGALYRYEKARDKFNTGMVTTGNNSMPTGFGWLGELGLEAANKVKTIYNNITGQDQSSATANPNMLPSIQDIVRNYDQPDFGKSSAFSSINNVVTKENSDNQKSIEWHAGNVASRQKPSEYFQQQLETGSQLYGLGGMAGTAASMMGPEAAAIAANASLTLISAASGNEAGAVDYAAKLASGAISFYSAAYQRNLMNNQELDQYSVQKLNQSMADLTPAGKPKAIPIAQRSDLELISKATAGTSGNDLINKARTEYNNGQLSPETRSALVDGINNFSIGFNDATFNHAKTSVSRNLDEFLGRDTAYSANTLAQIAITTMPMGSMVKTGFSTIAKDATKDMFDDLGNLSIREGDQTLVSRGLAATIDAKNAVYRATLEPLMKSKAAPYISLAAMHAVDGSSMYLEQVGKYVNGINYVNDNMTDNGSLVHLLMDGLSAPISGTRQALGLSNDNRYINNAALANTGYSGFVMGMVMPFPMDAFHIAGAQWESRNDSFGQRFVQSNILANKSAEVVDGNIANDIDSKFRVDKSKMYVTPDMKSPSKSMSVLKALQGFVSNPPEGYTSQDMQAELDAANETISVANSKGVLNYVKRNTTFGSEDHKLMTGLVVDHLRTMGLSEDETTKQLGIAKGLELDEYKNNPMFSQYFDAATADERNNITAVDSRSIFGLKNKLSVIDKLISLKEASDKNEEDQDSNGYKSRESQTYKRELHLDKLKTQKLLDESTTGRGLSDDLIANIPDVNMSDDYQGALAKSITANAGIAYDSESRAAFLGYELTNKKGNVNFTKMSDDDHDKFVESRLDKYRKAREGEMAMEQEASGREAAQTAMSEQHTTAEQAAISHPGQKVTVTPDEAEPELTPIIPSQPEPVVPTEPKPSTHITDPMMDKAVDTVLKSKRVNQTLLEKSLNIDDEQSSSIIKRMEDAGVISEKKGIQQKREVLATDKNHALDLLSTKEEPYTSTEKVAEEPTGVKPETSATEALQNTFPPVDETKPTNIPPVDLGTLEDKEAAFNAEAPSVKEPEIEQTPENSFLGEGESFEEEIPLDEISSIFSGLSNATDALIAANQTIPPTQEGAEGSQSQFEKSDDAAAIAEEYKSDNTVSAFRVNRLYFGQESDAFGRSNRKLSNKGRGFRTAVQLGDMLKSEEGIANCTFEIGSESDDMGVFDKNTPATYGYAKIYVKITKSDGPHKGEYIALITDPNMPLGEKQVPPSAQNIADLADLRANIISMLSFTKAKDENNKTQVIKKVVATLIKLKDGIIDTVKNKNNPMLHEQRTLDKIPGFKIPVKENGEVNWNAVTSNSMKLKFGSGEVNANELLDPQLGASGLQTRQSNSGNLYLLVPKNVTKELGKVKVNLKQFSREDPSIPSFLTSILSRIATGDTRMYISDSKGKQVDAGMNALEFLSKIVNFGPKTEVNKFRTPEERAFLLPKQFYVDEENGMLNYGENQMSMNDLGTTEGQATITKFITENLHWTFDKMDAQNDAGKDNRVSDLFPHIDNLLHDETNNVETAKLTDGIEFSKEDMDLTWTAWMMKNGKITSDAIDDIYTAPFMHLEQFKVVDKDATPTVLTTTGNSFKEAVNDPKEVSTEPKVDLQTQIDNQEKAVDAMTKLVETNPGESNKSILEEERAKLEELKSQSVEPVQEVEVPKVETLADAGFDDDLTFDDLMNDSVIDENNSNLPSAPRLIEGEIKKKINTIQESQWIVDKLGVDPKTIKVLEQVLTSANDKKSMGLMLADSIKLWAGAEEGTGYHEAFHRVSLLMFSRAERNRVYDLVRNTNPAMREASRSNIEEYLAEEFRSYKLTNKEIEAPSRVQLFMRKIANFTRSMFGLGPKDLDRLYKDIDMGVFKGHSINQNSLNEFKSEYGGEAPYGLKELGLTQIQTYDQLFNVRDALLAFTFKLEGVNGVDDISNIKFDRLKKVLTNSIAKEQDPQKKALFQEIEDNFDNVFEPKLIRSLSLMGIRQVDENNATESSSNQISDEAADHTKASYEISKKDNIRTGVKMFIATMEQATMENNKLIFSPEPLTGWNRFVPFDVSWNTMIVHLSNESSVTSMMEKVQRLSENNAFYKNLLNKLSAVDKDGNPRLDENFKTQFWNTMFSLRHEFVNIGYKEQLQGQKQISSSFNIMDADVDRAVKTLPAAWGQMFAEDNNIFPVNPETGEKSFNAEYIKSIQDRFKNEAVNPAKWKELGIDITNTDGRRRVIDSVVGLYNSIGIGVDADTIEYMMSDGKTSPENAIKSLTKYLSDKDSGKMSIMFENILSRLVKNEGALAKKNIWTGKETETSQKNIFSGEKFAKQLAAAYVKVHPTPEEVTVLGADGARLYQISLNSYLSDKIRDLRQDPKAMMDALTSTYNKGRTVNERMVDVDGNITMVPISRGSRVLYQVQKGLSDGLHLKTFVKLYEDDTKDKGRDYLDLSPAEDYVMKMAAMSNDYMVLPTMADKKTWMMLQGAKLIHEGIVYNRSIVRNGDGTTTHVVHIDFGQEAKSQMGEYFIAELNSVKDAWNQFKAKNGDKDQLIETYHFGGKNPATGEKWAGGHGNGLRFRHFGELSGTLALGEDVSTHKLSLNDYLDAAVKSDEKKGLDLVLDNLERIFVTNKETETTQGATEVRDNLMNSSLLATLDKELEHAASIGVIQYNGGGDMTSLKNILLDKGTFNKHSIESSKSTLNTVHNYSEQAGIIQMIGEGMVNGIISVNEFEKLVAGDPAFYKDPDTKIKRLSSILSTGTNTRTGDWPTNHELAGVTEFSSSELKDNEIGSRQYDEIKSKFLANSINNKLSAKGKATIPNLLDLIQNKFKNEDNQNKEQLAELIQHNKSNSKEFSEGQKQVETSYEGYNKGRINQTDATVYITPTMYKNLVKMWGEWTPAMQKSFDLLESTDQSWMSDDKLYGEVMQMALKPLKTIYFGNRVDEERNLNVPKLDKMAMFCLFKSMAGGDLADLYDRMNTTDPTMKKIDMVPFNSAVKVGNSKTMSYYTDETQSEINDLSKMVLDIQEYKNIRRQLLTDPHEDANTGLGTQANKTGLSNIDKTKVYDAVDFNGKKFTGAEILDAAKRANVALSDKGVDSITKELGIKPGEDGRRVVDEGRLYKMLSDDATDSNMPVDLIEKLNQVDENGKRYPLQALTDWKWIESRIMSNVGKKVVDVETPGGMFIQMTPFGLKSGAKSKASDFTQETVQERLGTKYLINGGKPLKFLSEDGSMECAVSINLFKDILPKNLKNFKDQKEWLLMHDIIGENAEPNSVGYRIPTQGLSSMSSLKISDVLPSNIGDTIVLPDEFTKLTGSDFDIDKLYVARHNFIKNEAGRMVKVNFDDSLRGENGEDAYAMNSKEAVQNRLLDTFHAVLRDKDNVQETRMPLDTVTDDLKGKFDEDTHQMEGILPDVERLIGKTTDHYPFEYLSPAYQSQKKLDYTTGKSGIAPFALNNSHHVLTQSTDLEFNNRGPIAKFGMNSLHSVTGVDGKRILDWLSAMINAHVDIAKDPYITRLNVNSYTYNATNLLLRSGMGENTFYFLPQPILKEIADGVRDLTGKYGVDKTLTQSDKEEAIFNVTYNKYMNKAKEALALEKDPDGRKKRLLDGLSKYDEFGHKQLTNDHVLDKQWLRTQLADKSNSFDSAYNQLLVADTYKELQPFAKSLAELVKYSQIDNKKWGNSIAAINLFADNVEAIKSLGNKSVFANVSQFYEQTFLNSKLNNALNTANAIGEGKFFRTTSSVKNFIETMAGYTSSRNITNEDTLVAVANATDSMIKSKWYLDLAKERGVEPKDLFFGNDTLAKRLYQIKQNINNEVGPYALLKNNAFLSNIEPEIVERLVGDKAKDQRPDHIYVTNSIKNDNMATEIKEYWAEILDSPIPEVQKFAHDFGLYQFFSNGENSAFNQVKQSEDVRKDMGFGDFIDKKLKEFSNTDTPFEDSNDAMDEIFRNRWYDDKLVPQVQLTKKGESMGDVGGHQMSSGYNAPSIPSRETYAPGKAHEAVFIQEDARPVGKNGNKEQVYRPFVKVSYKLENGKPTYILYKLIGSVPVMEEKEDGTTGQKVDRSGNPQSHPVYVATNKKSESVSGRNIVEFGMAKSMIPSNDIGSLGGMYEGFTHSNADFTKATKAMVDLYNADPRFGSARISKNNADAFANFRPLGDNTIDDTQPWLDEIRSNPAKDLHDKVKEYISAAENTKDHESAAINLHDDLVNQGYSDGLVAAADYEFAKQLLTSKLTKEEEQIINMSDFTNHSGGAIGADSQFDAIGKEFGVTNHIHYFHGNKTPLGNRELTDSELKEGISEMRKAAVILDKNPQKQTTIDLLARNWFQVKNSDQIVAVAPIAEDMKTVEGGTGWAVAMAQANKGKEVNVFNTKDNSWYQWNGTSFEKSDIPTLQKNFAGIGSRQDGGKMTPESMQAIRDVYTKAKQSIIEGEKVAENGSKQATEAYARLVMKTLEDEGVATDYFNNVVDKSSETQTIIPTNTLDPSNGMQDSMLDNIQTTDDAAIEANNSDTSSGSKSTDIVYNQPNILTGYQGIRGESDSRQFNYYTLNENEAKDYGNVVTSKDIDISKFLHKRAQEGGFTPEYKDLAREFEARTGKTFDILDNGPEGMKTQNQFFEFLQSKGYEGYSDIKKGEKTQDENAYFVTFNKQERALSDENLSKINDNVTKQGLPALTMDDIKGLSDGEIQKLINCN